MSLSFLVFDIPYSFILNPKELGATNWWATRKAYNVQGDGTLVLPDNIGTLNLNSNTITKTPDIQSGVNSIKKLIFNGTSNTIQTSITTLDQPVFLISVIKILNGNTGTPAIFDGGSSTNMLFDLSPNLNTFRMFSGDTLNAPNNVTDNLVIFSHLYLGNSSKLWINGVLQSTTGISTANNSPNGFTVGARANNINYSKIEYYETILFRKNITTTIHNNIGRNLAKIYNLSWNNI